MLGAVAVQMHLTVAVAVAIGAVAVAVAVARLVMVTVAVLRVHNRRDAIAVQRLGAVAGRRRRRGRVGGIAAERDVALRVALGGRLDGALDLAEQAIVRVRTGVAACIACGGCEGGERRRISNGWCAVCARAKVCATMRYAVCIANKHERNAAVAMVEHEYVDEMGCD